MRATDVSDNLQACLLIYDIPERSAVRNPSPRLRSMAVRVNLSCWVIREGDIPYALLNEMAAGGATWHVVRFDAGEGVKLVGMAVEAIKRDIRDAMRRANRSVDAVELLAGGAADPSEAKRVYAERVRPVVRRLNRLLADVGRAAERFGIDPSAVSLADAHAAVGALQAGMLARARAYGAAAEQVLALGDPAMAGAAAADLVPAGILADDIDDRGGDSSALRETFAT
jgi:hypothetical protein